MTSDQDTDTTLDAFLKEDIEEAADAAGDHDPIHTRGALAIVCLDEAMTTGDFAALDGDGPLAMIVVVPSKGWVKPIQNAIRSRWAFTDQASNARKKPGASDLLDESGHLADTLSRGGRVLGVSHAPATLLPPALVAAADVTVSIRPLSDRGLRCLIRWVTGKQVRNLPAGCIGADRSEPQNWSPILKLCARSWARERNVGSEASRASVSILDLAAR